MKLKYKCIKYVGIYLLIATLKQLSQHQVKENSMSLSCSLWWQNNQFSWHWTEINRNISISLIILRTAEGEASLLNAGSQFWCERAQILHCCQNHWKQDTIYLLYCGRGAKFMNLEDQRQLSAKPNEACQQQAARTNIMPAMLRLCWFPRVC